MLFCKTTGTIRAFYSIIIWHTNLYKFMWCVLLFIHQVLVVSSGEVAKECFTTHDKVFASRPKAKASEIMAYNYAIFGLAPYGDYWRQVRKIVMLEVLSQRRVEMLGLVRVLEVRASTKDLYEAWLMKKESEGSDMVQVDMKQWFGNLVFNILVRIISGKRFQLNDEEGVRFQNVARRFLELLGTFVVSDFVPFMNLFDVGGYVKEMKMTGKEMDNIIEGWLKNRKREKESGQQQEGDQFFMDVLISILQDASKEDFPGYDHDTVIKATCLDIRTGKIIGRGDDEEEITRLKARLFKEFEMKDLGRLKYFLGIEVMRSRKGIFICQKKYILDLLAETGMIDCKPVNTPMMMNQKLYMEENAKLADKGEYQRIVGKLIYLSHTRPDIAYAVGVVSQFMHQPQVTHMEALWRIIRYLKGTPGHGVLFKTNGHLEAHIYTDADWAGDKGNRRSTSGYFALVGGNLVTWRSKKQKVVALSSAEAEFRGIARGLAEILWIRKLLTEIGYPPPQSSKILCDNKAAIQISENPVQHDRTKHIEVDRHFIKEKLEAGIIDLPFVRSENQLADILTKAVSEKIFNHCLGKLNIENSTTQLEGEC
ncbi:putative cytochrome P450, reverse transcriptase, RNA-dependent DNA polymerase [Helianthus debilis subsp. tardiflorus]